MRLAWLPVASSSALALTAVISLIPQSTPAEKSSSSPPDFTLTIPALFNTSVAIRHYHRGDDIINSPSFQLITSAPMTEYYGSYGPRTADTLRGHPWRLRVYAARNPKVGAAYAKARDGFEAYLNEAKEFFGWGRVATFDTFARFKRKHFRWGNAVSFLHAEYQDGPDHGVYVPDNDHLSYEVWGVTRDRQYTVVASASVSHPKLASWRDGRVVDSIDALKRDRYYKVLETCSPDDFNPSLTVFDQLVDTLKLE